MVHGPHRSPKKQLQLIKTFCSKLWFYQCISLFNSKKILSSFGELNSPIYMKKKENLSLSLSPNDGLFQIWLKLTNIGSEDF